MKTHLWRNNSTNIRIWEHDYSDHYKITFNNQYFYYDNDNNKVNVCKGCVDREAPWISRILVIIRLEQYIFQYEDDNNS